MKTAGLCMIIFALLFIVDAYLISSYFEDVRLNFDNLDSLSTQVKVISCLQVLLLLTAGISLMKHADKVEERFRDIEFNITITESRIDNVEIKSSETAAGASIANGL